MSLLPRGAREKADPSRNAIKAFLTEAAAELPEGATVLDAGAGNCRYRPFFTRQRYIAADFCKVEDINYKRMDFVTDLNHLALKDGSMDAIINIQVLEHVLDPHRLVAELTRVLKPGGVLYLSCPQSAGIHMVPYDYYRFTKYALEDIFTRAGLRIDYIRPMGGYFHKLAKLISRLPFQFRKPEAGIFARALFKVKFVILKELFHYWLPFLIVHLDFLDKTKYFTDGYVCRVVKPGGEGGDADA